PLIKNNIITNNGAGSGGGIGLVNATGAAVLDNTILNNQANFGGGIFIFSSNGTNLQGNRITNNLVHGIVFGDGTPASQGGGIHVSSSSQIFLVQNLITSNTAGLGGGLSLSFSNVIAVNNTIAENSVTNRNSALYVEGNVSGAFYNSLLIAKQGQDAIGCGFAVSASQLIFRNNNVYSSGGWPVAAGCSVQFGVSSDGNISADPLFVNSSAGDFHLRQSSPAIEAGNNQAPNLPATDLDGHPRLIDVDSDGLSVVDMGAYEFESLFDICLEDDVSGDSLQFNSRNGNYRFFSCKDNLIITGTGVVSVQACKVVLTANDINGTVSVLANTCTKQANAMFQSSAKRKKYAISDANISNSICSCR